MDPDLTAIYWTSSIDVDAEPVCSRLESDELVGACQQAVGFVFRTSPPAYSAPLAGCRRGGESGDTPHAAVAECCLHLPLEVAARHGRPRRRTSVLTHTGPPAGPGDNTRSVGEQ
jgi:hypothetical protein